MSLDDGAGVEEEAGLQEAERKNKRRVRAGGGEEKLEVKLAQSLPNFLAPSLVSGLLLAKRNQREEKR